MPPVIFSAAEDSFDLAVRELRDAFGPRLTVDRLGPDVGTASADDLSVAAVARTCAARPIVFVKHLTAQIARLPLDPALEPKTVAAAALASVGPVPASVAVQAWVSGRSELGFGSAEAHAAIADEVRHAGGAASRAGQEYVLSCCLTPHGVLLGYNRTADSITDWPGGRVRLSRGPDQISRAEFKLEEAFGAFAVALPSRGRAVDYGAAPGGWTRILRQRGLSVTAVDPGDLDPRVAADPGVRHLRTTAGEYLRTDWGDVDVIVNDMRMEPRRSCELMVSSAPRLKPGALAVVTLKTGTGRRVLATVEDCLRLLESGYAVVGARQLHHNRDEVTVLLRRFGVWRDRPA